MDASLKDRKVVITGVGDGIGRALALAFAAAGARVAGCSRTVDRLEHVQAEADGDHHLFTRADVTQPADIQRFHDQVLDAFGGTDVLVNNVGDIGKLVSFFELTDDDWQAAFETNLLSAVRLCRVFIPTLRHSGAPRIINISSIASSSPGERFPHYAALKAGMSALTVSLSTALAPDHILVNTVSPGPVWTRSWEKEAQDAAKTSGKPLHSVVQEIQKTTAETVPLKRMGVPEDVTGIVLFLASDQAAWITGANFVVDGGVLHNPF